MFLRILITLLVLAALGAGLWFGREPLYTAFRLGRSEMLLLRSKDAAKKGDVGVAHQFATAAWQLQPGKYPFLHRLYHHAREIGLSELPAMTVVVFLHPEVTVDDQQDILRWVLTRGDNSFFTQLYQSLEDERKLEPGVRLLYAESLARQGRVLEAVEEARVLDEVPATSTEASLLLTSLLPLLDNNPLAWSQARDRIAKLLETADEETALRAWRNLRLLPAEYRDPGLKVDLLTWIRDKEKATAADRLLASQLELTRLPPAEQEAKLERIQSEFESDEEALRYLARWYLETGQTERLLKLKPEAFQSDAQLFSSRLQALIDLNRMAEAEKWLKDAPASIPESLTLSLQAAMAGKAGRQSESVTLWQKVLATAKSLAEFKDCVTIHQVALRFGDTKVARQAVDIIVGLPPEKLPRSEALEFLEGHFLDRPAEWLAFWKKVSRSRPQDSFATEQVAFLQLFVPDPGKLDPEGKPVAGQGGTDPAEAVKRTELLWKRFPGILRYRTTHALWLVLQGRAEEAVMLLKQAKVNWNQAPDADRVALSLAEFRAGNERDGNLMLQGIRWEAMSPMRRFFLAQVPKQAPTRP